MPHSGAPGRTTHKLAMATTIHSEIGIWPENEHQPHPFLIFHLLYMGRGARIPRIHPARELGTLAAHALAVGMADQHITRPLAQWRTCSRECSRHLLHTSTHVYHAA